MCRLWIIYCISALASKTLTPLSATRAWLMHCGLQFQVRFACCGTFGISGIANVQPRCSAMLTTKTPTNSDHILQRHYVQLTHAAWGQDACIAMQLKVVQGNPTGSQTVTTACMCTSEAKSNMCVCTSSAPSNMHNCIISQAHMHVHLSCSWQCAHPDLQQLALCMHEHRKSKQKSASSRIITGASGCTQRQRGTNLFLDSLETCDILCTSKPFCTTGTSPLMDLLLEQYTDSCLPWLRPQVSLHAA